MQNRSEKIIADPSQIGIPQAGLAPLAAPGCSVPNLGAASRGDHQAPRPVSGGHLSH
jgi:hypothetical protein